MTLRPSAFALTFLFAGLFGSACPASTEDECDVGTEGCACTPGGSCDPGLTCASSTCVDLGPGSSDGPATAEGSASASSASSTTEESGEASASASESEADSADESSTGVDECTANGGQRLPSGFCYKECEYASRTPGDDLFEDCVALGMTCRDAYYAHDYCGPPEWDSECTSDADCGQGGVCVTRDTGPDFEPTSNCHIGCSEGSDCGSLFCVETCPTGFLSPLPFCDDTEGPYGLFCCPSYPTPC